MIAEYEALGAEILAALTPASHAAAIALAALHGTIRGYDVVKDAAIAAVAAKQPELRAAFQCAAGAIESEDAAAARR